MSSGGALSRFSPIFAVAAAATLVVGYFVSLAISQSTEKKLMSSLPTQPNDVLVPLATRLEATTDVKQLLLIGHKLAEQHEVVLALPILKRAEALAPENPFVNYLLAWTLLDAANRETDLTTKHQYLVDAQAAITVAQHLDPLSPDIKELATRVSLLGIQP